MDSTAHLLLLCLAVLVVGFLYAAVGHAGASGYIAVMTLFGLDSALIRPTALVLNIAVASITFWQFFRAGHFRGGLFWSFAALAIPAAFLGGYLSLPTRAFRVLVGLVLLFSAWRFLTRPGSDTGTAPPPLRASLPIGAGLGLLAGLTGTGGGIFLTPLLILKKWAPAAQAAAVSALFILVNSAAGLAGNLSGVRMVPAFTPYILAAAMVGGAAGSYLGSHRFDHLLIKRLLAAVLLIAGIKLLLG